MALKCVFLLQSGNEEKGEAKNHVSSGRHTKKDDKGI